MNETLFTPLTEEEGRRIQEANREQLQVFTPATTADHLEADWPPEIGHISASSIKMAAKCMEQWRRRYIKGEKIPPAGALIQGRADHKAIEANFREKLTTGEDIPVPDVQTIFAEEVDQEIEKAGGAAEIDFGKAVKGKTARRKAAGEMKDSGVALVTEYRVVRAPTFQPIAVEEAFTLTVPGVPVPIIGYLDLVGRQWPSGFYLEGSTPEPPLVIRDRKTSNKAVRKPEPENRVQAGTYMLHRWLPHEWDYSVKTKVPKIVTADMDGYEGLVLKPSPGLKRQIEMNLHHLVRKIGFYYSTFGPDETWDGATLHSWACDYCGFRPTCGWWNRPQDVARRKNGAT